MMFAAITASWFSKTYNNSVQVLIQFANTHWLLLPAFVWRMLYFTRHNFKDTQKDEKDDKKIINRKLQWKVAPASMEHLSLANDQLASTRHFRVTLNASSVLESCLTLHTNVLCVCWISVEIRHLRSYYLQLNLKRRMLAWLAPTYSFICNKMFSDFHNTMLRMR